MVKNLKPGVKTIAASIFALSLLALSGCSNSAEQTTTAPAPAPSASDDGGSDDGNAAPSDGGGQAPAPAANPGTSGNDDDLDDDPILSAPTGHPLNYGVWTAQDLAQISGTTGGIQQFPIDVATVEAFAVLGFQESEPQSFSCDGAIQDSNGVPVTCTFTDTNGATGQAYAYGIDDNGDDAAGVLLVVGEPLPAEIASRLDDASVYAYGQGSMFGVNEGIPAAQVSEILTQTVANGIAVGIEDDYAQGVSANCTFDIGIALEGPNMVPCTVTAGDDTHQAVAIAGDIVNSGDRGLVVIIDD